MRSCNIRRDHRGEVMKVNDPFRKKILLDLQDEIQGTYGSPDFHAHPLAQPPGYGASFSLPTGEQAALVVGKDRVEFKANGYQDSTLLEDEQGYLGQR
jgi:hypothetical protein